MGSKESDMGSSKNYKEISKDGKGMNVDKLVDLYSSKVKPQTKGATHRDNQRNTHLYPRQDMVWCGVCA